MDQWNRIESPQINLHTYRQLIFNKRVFGKWCWGSWTATCKSMNLGHTLSPHTNSKWLKDLNKKRTEAKYSLTLMAPIFSLVNLSKQGTEKQTKMGPNQTCKVFSSKVNHKQNKKRTYRVGENICK